jgi:hypothetical protein
VEQRVVVVLHDFVHPPLAVISDITDRSLNELENAMQAAGEFLAEPPVPGPRL